MDGAALNSFATWQPEEKPAHAARRDLPLEHHRRVVHVWLTLEGGITLITSEP